MSFKSKVSRCWSAFKANAKEAPGLLLAILGVVFILGGIVLGVYLGVVWGFIGGIVQVVESVQTNPLPAYKLAWGIARFFFASTIGVVFAFTCVALGIGCIHLSE